MNCRLKKERPLAKINNPEIDYSKSKMYFSYNVGNINPLKGNFGAQRKSCSKQPQTPPPFKISFIPTSS